MTRTLYVGDLHAKPDLLPLIANVAVREHADRIVLLGDVADDWTLSNAGMARWAADFARWADAMAADVDVVPLAGNHDVPYLMDRGSASFARVRAGSPGFRPGAHRTAHAAWAPLPWHVAWADGRGRLASHAGVTAAWAAARGLKGADAAGLAAWLDGRLAHPASLAALAADAGPARGGDGLPGPLWADASELTRDPMPGVEQIVGHTPVGTVTRAGGLWFCDTFSAAPDGRPLGDGTMLLDDDGELRPVPLFGRIRDACARHG
ncbi:metallophosphatase family protein [Bifidobacterium myosotis]|uniref:Metallophosphatase family protein n=1 Tax=Bifidobacterium myosotis TaxID=1630166 RepID=A0A5M9ZN05_9BIFI|nr:metallophosphatase family protein [Bifidobacterium myosotis]